jgi:type II secretory pathway predicted ATPase ExeA
MWSDLRYFQASLYSLSEKKHLSIQKIMDSPGEVSDSAIWQALAADEKTAPTVDIPHDKPKGELVRKLVDRSREKTKTKQV